jgi:hypothetical protein
LQGQVLAPSEETAETVRLEREDRKLNDNPITWATATATTMILYSILCLLYRQKSPIDVVLQ